MVCRGKRFYEPAGKRKSGYDLSDPRKRNARRPFWDRTTAAFVRSTSPSLGARQLHRDDKQKHRTVFSSVPVVALVMNRRARDRSVSILDSDTPFDSMPLKWPLTVTVIQIRLASLILINKTHTHTHVQEAREAMLLIKSKVIPFDGDSGEICGPLLSLSLPHTHTHTLTTDIVSRFTSATLIRAHPRERVAPPPASPRAGTRLRANSRTRPIAGSVFWESLSDAFRCTLANKTGSPSEY